MTSYELVNKYLDYLYERDGDYEAVATSNSTNEILAEFAEWVLEEQSK